MTVYILFEHSIPYGIMNIVRYLRERGVNLEPRILVDREFPISLQLPSIYDETLKLWFVGKSECIRYMEERSHVSNLEKLLER